MKVASLTSGGKDSIYAIYVSVNHGWDVKYMVSLFPQRDDSWMFHSININLVKEISKSMGIPLVTGKTSGEKEGELEDLKRVLEGLDIDGVISGAIASDYQRERICGVCDELKIKCFSPLWHKNQKNLLRQQIDAGFKIRIDQVSAEGLGREWLGKIIDENNFEDFIEVCKKYRINPSGEGGEFETIVLDCPLYRKEIIVDDFEIRWYKDRGYFIIKKVFLRKKSIDDIPKFL